jgi:hypothetical protein
MVNRVNILWGILGVVGGMALGAWYMGPGSSRRQRCGTHAPPEPSPILVPVSRAY